MVLENCLLYGDMSVNYIGLLHRRECAWIFQFWFWPEWKFYYKLGFYAAHVWGCDTFKCTEFSRKLLRFLRRGLPLLVFRLLGHRWGFYGRLVRLLSVVVIIHGGRMSGSGLLRWWSPDVMCSEAVERIYPGLACITGNTRFCAVLQNVVASVRWRPSSRDHAPTQRTENAQVH